MWQNSGVYHGFHHPHDLYLPHDLFHCSDIYTEFATVILGCVIILEGMPWCIKLFCVLCFDDSYDSEEKLKRWQSRNVQDFSYKIPEIASDHSDAVTIDIELSFEKSQIMSLNQSQIREKGGSSRRYSYSFNILNQLFEFYLFYSTLTNHSYIHSNFYFTFIKKLYWYLYS